MGTADAALWGMGRSGQVDLVGAVKSLRILVSRCKTQPYPLPGGDCVLTDLNIGDCKAWSSQHWR
ncbi:hypothetical protein [Mycobacterium lepromatosis]|uniref:hypothetical protein n=1 Tax=Mycobacterium lepromatosis TaxID=480418 RepID=UPI0005F88F7E|nr:hypothetical protein [Mycobacterium lepromatosis]